MAKPTKKQREVLEKMAAGTVLQRHVYFKDKNPSYWLSEERVPASTVIAMYKRGWLAFNIPTTRYRLTPQGRAAIGAPLA